MYAQRGSSVASAFTEDDLEAQGLQPHPLSTEDKIVAVALLRTMAQSEAPVEAAEQDGHDDCDVQDVRAFQ